MAKLFFRYGTMGSGKSLDLLKVAFNYEENNMDVLILTSSIDNRYGDNIVKSRTGIKREAQGISANDNILDVVHYKKNVIGQNIKCILVDEVQFFTKNHIYQLSEVVDKLDIPVICYGLRSDFKLEPFGATQYLMSIADEIEELRTICSECGKKKSIVNARFNDDGMIITSGNQVEIGGNEKYRPLCRTCYENLKK